MDEKIKKINIFIKAKKDVVISKKQLQLAIDYKTNDKQTAKAKKTSKNSELFFYLFSFSLAVCLFSFPLSDFIKWGAFIFTIYTFSFLILLMNYSVHSNEKERYLKSKGLIESSMNKKINNITSDELLDEIEIKHETNNKKLKEIKDLITKELILDIDKSDFTLNSEEILAIKELSAIKKIKPEDYGLLRRSEALTQKRQNILEAIKDLSENESLDDDTIKALKKELDNYNVNKIEIRNE